MATPKETEGGPEPVTPLLNTLIEAIKNAADETDRAAQVAKARDEMQKLGKDRIDIEKNEAQITTKNIENTNTWVGHNDEFINQQAYKKSPDAAVQLTQSKAMLNVVFSVGNPDWLISGPDSIQHCAEAAEFVSRVSLLPQPLRDNPDVLYRETMRYTASLQWESMTIEAQKEAHQVLDNAMRKYLELRYKNQISVEFDIAEKMLRTLVQSSSETGKTPVFYVENEVVKKIKVPGAQKPLDEQLAELQKQVQMDNPLVHDPVQLAKTIDNLKREYGEDKVALYVAKLRRMQTIEHTAREEGREKYFSNIGLQESAMEALWKGGREAEWAIDEYLQLIERSTKKYPSGEIGEALHHRVGLIASYFSDKQYVNDLQEYAAKNFKSVIEQQKFVEAASNQIFLLQEKIQSRIGALVTYGHIKLKGDPETISQSLLQLGTRGVNFILAENGGINERIYNRYVTLMKLARFSQTHSEEPEPYTAETLFQLRRKIKDEVKHDVGLYNQQYQSYWGEAHQLDDKVIDSIVRQVEVVVSITQQDLVALRDAPGPERREARPGDVLASSSFLSMSTAERFLSAMDVDSYAFEKWGKLTDYPLYMWRKMCELAAIGGNRHKTSVLKLLEGVNKGDAKFLELAKLAFGSEEKMVKLLKLEKQAHPGIFPWLRKTPEKFSDLTLKQLKHELIIRDGKMIMTEILEAYDNFSSGWRIIQYLIQLNRMYGTCPVGEEGNKKYIYGTHHLGLGMQLRKAGYDLIHAENEETRHKHEGRVRNVLKNEIALYRPQAIFEFLYTNGDKDSKKWFQKDIVAQGKLTKQKLGRNAENITRVDQFYNYISRNFIAINDSLADAGLGPINYETGPTKNQMKVIKKVCEATGTNAKAYVQIMKETSEFAKQESNINKLVQTEYYHIYHRTKWVDDLRMRYLENPDIAPGSRTKAEYDGTSKEDPKKIKAKIPHIKLSETFVEDGSGGGDQLPRSWNDLGVALQTLDFLTLALTHDKKQFLENVKKVYDGVARYSGYTPAAGRAAIYLLGGFGEAAATDKELNLFLLNAIDNSSAAKRLVGDKGLSNSPGQNLELTEEFEGLLLSKLHNLAPHLAEEAEKFIGIRWGWVPDQLGEVGHHLPAWADRAKIATILIDLLVITQAVKEAEKEASGKDTKH